MSGAKMAQNAKAAMTTIAMTLSGSRRIGARAATRAGLRSAGTVRSATLDPWIEPVVGDVHQQIRQGIDDGGEQGHAEHRGEVEAHRRGGRVAAQTRPAEDRFGEHRARQKAAE